MNSRDLDEKIKKLTEERDRRRSSFISTSDKTRDLAGSIQNGMYWGQLALGLFRNITNYHLTPKKRVKRVLMTAAVLMAANMLRKRLSRKKA